LGEKVGEKKKEAFSSLFDHKDIYAHMY